MSFSDLLAPAGLRWRIAAVTVALLGGLVWAVSLDGAAPGADVAGLLVWLAWGFAAASVVGIGVVVAGAMAVRSFTARPGPRAMRLPPVSVLRPLSGDEPALDAALASLCEQRYPLFQIVFGVHDAADPALGAVERVRARFPGLDIAVVANPALHGRNRKVCNLINMLPLARYDTLVFSDSDLHVAPDYLEQLMSVLDAPGAGLVTTLCTGRTTVPGLAARLGAMQITHCFLPGALLSRALGRQDCLGTTMALRRETLARVGGLGALVDHLADDNVLGQRVRQLGMGVTLAGTVPATAVPEASLAALWQHELRWARTIRALEPAAFAASAVQFPLAWAGLAWVCAAGPSWPAGPSWAAGLFAGAWVVRGLAQWAISRRLPPGGVLRRRDRWIAAGLLPVRDLLSVGEIAASYFGGEVRWRGHVMRVGRDPASGGGEGRGDGFERAALGADAEQGFGKRAAQHQCAAEEVAPEYLGAGAGFDQGAEEGGASDAA